MIDDEQASRRIPRVLLIACALAFVMTMPLAYAQRPPSNELTGLEWLQMSAGERTEQVVFSMAVLAKGGVQIHGSPSEYYDLILSKLSRQVNLYGALLTDILAAEVYAREPASRATLDSHRVKPKIRQIEMH